MTNSIIEQKIDALLALLVSPLTSSEAADGWTPECKQAMTVFFEELVQKLKAGEQLPSLSISRSLDHWGVVKGELLEKVAQISNELRASGKTTA